MWRAKSTIQAIDSAAKEEVGKAVEVAKSSPEPRVEDLWTDIYYKGTEPPSMRGREREEVCEAVFSSDQRAYQFSAGSRLLRSQGMKCGTRAAWIAIDSFIIALISCRQRGLAELLRRCYCVDFPFRITHTPHSHTSVGKLSNI